MSDTKEFNNRLDYVERKRLQLEQELATVRQELGRTRSENTRLRAECRRLDQRFDQVGTELRAQLSTRKTEAEDHPGGRSLAGRVRQATAAVHIYDAIAEGDHRA